MSSRPGALKGGPISRLKEQNATATNVASPKGISKKTPNSSAGDNINVARRRLSVVSDNKLVEGIDNISTSDGQDVQEGGLSIAAYAGVSKKGYAPYNPKKKNQDTLVMAVDEPTNSLLLCVFDGHGEAGDGVSQFFKAHVADSIFKHASFPPTGNRETDIQGIKKAITVALNTLEQKILRESRVDTEFSGTTAVVTVIRGDLLVAGNVGDSRITRGFLDGSGKIKAEPITDDHKPDRPDEKSRILGVGGRVFAVEYDDGIDGPPRVWLGHMDVPGLAMSRSLGDTIAHSAGVSSEPEFSVQSLTSNDKYLVLATDGLWEFMTDQEVLDMVTKYDTPKKAVDALIVEANARWMKQEQVIDDTTVIVANIHL